MARPWIQINGKNSNSVNGLLIVSLPAITKPQMRVKTTTIDGRDGDIITRLGFNAYDRKFKIGLYGNYDINEVIEFFNASGSVIFSNEPDLVYEFEQLKAIDFKKLVRFKTADVTMHVQPFKKSIKDSPLTFEFDQNLITIFPYEGTKNGVTFETLAAGYINFSGTPSHNVDLYVPIKPIKAHDGALYNLSITGLGSGVSSSYVRLIEDAPTDTDSFGGQYINPANLEKITIESNLEGGKTFNYIWIYIQRGQPVDFTLAVNLKDKSNTFKVQNNGNTIAQPIITFYGSDNITFNFNDSEEIFTLNLADDEYITVDGASMNAYKGNVYKNRQLSGNFDYFFLKTGVNKISFSGDVEKIEISDYTRFV